MKQEVLASQALGSEAAAPGREPLRRYLELNGTAHQLIPCSEASVPSAVRE
jgi:hypothetical protein